MEIRVEDNLGLVGKAIKMHYTKCINISPLTTYEDLYAVGCIGLFKATKGFKEEEGNKFSTYAMKCICGEIRRYLRDRVFGKEGCNTRIYNKEVYIDNTVATDEKKESSYDVFFGSIDNQYEETELNLIIDNLNVKETYKDIIRYKLQGKNQTEIGELVGVGQVSVSRALKKIKSILKEELSA